MTTDMQTQACAVVANGLRGHLRDLKGIDTQVQDRLKQLISYLEFPECYGFKTGDLLFAGNSTLDRLLVDLTAQKVTVDSIELPVLKNFGIGKAYALSSADTERMLDDNPYLS